MEKRGKIRLGIGVIILLFTVFSFYFVLASNGDNNWIIEGNKVYVDDSKVYISAEPHTIQGSGYVYFNVTSKDYEGNIDLVLGFDTTKVKPVKAELYKPEWIEQTGSYACDFTNSYFNYTLSPKHFWCYINNTARGNGTGGIGLILIYERDFEHGNLEEKTAYWNESYLQEYKDITGVWESLGYNYQDMNKWYYKRNIPIHSNVNYQFRVLVNMDRKNGFSPESIDTKYWFAIKPSSETLQQSIANAHFYALDPWINSTGCNQNKNYLDIDLIAYLKLDNSGLDSLAGVYNGTWIGSPGWSVGIINASTYHANSDDNHMNLTNKGMSWLNDSKFSIAFWFMRKDSGQADIMAQTPSAGVYIYNDGGGPTFRYGNYPSNGYNINTGNGVDADRWYFIVMTHNGTGKAGVKIYQDGSEDTSLGSAGSDYITGSTTTASTKTFIGSDFSGSVYGDHLIDEIGIWNRTLNASEVADLYNNGLGITYTPVAPDTISPETTIPIITPTQPKTTDNLQCNAILTDNMQTRLIANWTWYKNNISYLSGIKTNIQNGTPTIITTLEAGNTSKGEQWKCEVTPLDGYNYGEPKNSTSVTILNTPPNQSQPMLTSPSGKNFHYENITCYNQSTYDADNDKVTNIFNWYKNSQPLAVLNMPFEINAKDYSGKENNGTIYGASFTDGKVGNALNFDGVNDYVEVNDAPSLDITKPITIEAWIKPSGIQAGYARILFKGDGDSPGVWAYGLAYDPTGNYIRLLTYTTSAVTSISPAINTTTQWYHVVGTYNGSIQRLYINGIEVDSDSQSGNLRNAGKLGIGAELEPTSERYFNGSIDEVRIYDKVLTPEQIKAHYNLEYTKVVSQETSAGDNWMCQVTPNDGEDDGETKNSSSLEVLFAITFNVTYGEDGSQESNFNIDCDNGFSVSGINSPYPAGFGPGNYVCVFSKNLRFDRTVIFTADDDKTVSIILSKEGQLTVEEHTWLEAIYNCLYQGDCSLYNLLLEINQTVGNIWEHTKPTDESVVTFENLINKVVNATSNLTINYTVNIPIKAGYGTGDYLPVRIGFWFLDANNITCYNQGDKPTGVEDPYCQPLIIETIGPMGGSVSFVVKLRPELPAGNYNIKRIIDIDPQGTWINYGQETLGIITLTEALSDSGIALEKTGETMPSSNQPSQSSSGGGSGGGGTTIIKEKEVMKIVPQEESEDKESKGDGGEVETSGGVGITGGVIGSKILSKDSLVFLIVLLNTFILVYFIVSSKIKKNLK